MSKAIKEEDNVHQDWMQEAREQNMESLSGFISKLMDDYIHDYGTICHAMAACAVATISAMNRSEQGGISGHQAGVVSWELLKGFGGLTMGRSGARLVNFDDMLDPQNEPLFKTISEETWLKLFEQAESSIKNKENADPKVIEHWHSIVNGVVPFGFTIGES